MSRNVIVWHRAAGAAVHLLLLAGVLGFSLNEPLLGQTVRISGITTFRYLDVRPYIQDSVLATDASGSGLLRTSDDGQVVRCTTGDPFCRFRRPGSTVSSVPAVQDLMFNVWGLGTGVRAYARLRGRAAFVGEETIWPRGGDRFDVMTAYLELNRETWRGRVGRHWKTSGLGYYNFDGASVLLRPVRSLTLEAFGGRSLVQNLNEPLTSDEYVEVEPIAPDVGSYLIGAQFSVRPNARLRMTALYQREIRTDRLGLYSERVAFNGTVRVGGSSIDAALKVDWATATLNEGRIRLWLAPIGPMSVNVYARHHRPFFDLWTIWGAFSPLDFDEVGFGAALSPGGPMALEFSGAARRYSGSQAQTLFGDARSDGWRFRASTSVTVAPAWILQGQYRTEIGFGAAKSDITARLQHELTSRNMVGINLALFQQLYEFRVDESTVLAIGTDTTFARGPRTRLVGGITAYRHQRAGDAPNADWTQLRGSLRIEWTVGPEPGIRTPSGGTR